MKFSARILLLLTTSPLISSTVSSESCTTPTCQCTSSTGAVLLLTVLTALLVGAVVGGSVFYVMKYKPKWLQFKKEDRKHGKSGKKRKPRKQCMTPADDMPVAKSVIKEAESSKMSSQNSRSDINEMRRIRRLLKEPDPLLSTMGSSQQSSSTAPEELPQ